jgi:hypothetical protein
MNGNWKRRKKLLKHPVLKNFLFAEIDSREFVDQYSVVLEKKLTILEDQSCPSLVQQWKDDSNYYPVKELISEDILDFIYESGVILFGEINTRINSHVCGGINPTQESPVAWNFYLYTPESYITKTVEKVIGSKASIWYRTVNPLLGDVSPEEMVRVGRYGKLLQFIDTQLTENWTKEG